MRKSLIFLLILCLLLPGCTAREAKVYNVTYLDLFDTVTSIMGAPDKEETFQKETQTIYEQLRQYHRLFDIYNEYEDLANLKTINDHAGVAPVKVEQTIIRFLLDCKNYYEMTDGNVNVAMGSVLRLWHEARTAGLSDPENAKLPDADAMALALEHTDISNVIIDEEASTVYLADPEMSLDVGAIAKGWATQKVAENAPAGMLISVGGNVCATGLKYADGTCWTIGIQNPDGGDYLGKIQIACGAVVTSGDYQRTYTVDGKQYHHIIDPATGMPSAYWRSVTVLCADSALADCLSTALFLLPLEEGMALTEKCGVEALWVNQQNEQFMTEGMKELVQE